MFTHDTLALNRPTAVLTERGTAVMLVYRLLGALRELDVEDRDDVLALLDEELAEPTA